MAIGFDKLVPDVQFDWIDRLSPNLEATRLLGARKQALGDLGLIDPSGEKDPLKPGKQNSDSLLKAGQRLFAAGDFEGGMKLLAEGRQLKQVENQGLANEVYKQWVNRGGPNQPGPAATGVIAPPDVFAPAGVTPVAPGRGAPASDKIFGPIPGTAPPPEPRAELAPVAEPPATEAFAQAPPEDPLFLESGRLATPPGARIGKPEETDPSKTLPKPPTLRGESDAFQEARHWGQILRGIPGHSLTGNEKAYALAMFRNALARANVTEDAKKWYNANADRIDEGMDPLSFDEYINRQKADPDVRKAAAELYKEHRAEGLKASKLAPTITFLEQLIRDPSWESGEGSADIHHLKARLRTYKDSLQGMGLSLPEGVNKMIDEATASVPLRDTFTAVVGSAIFEKLGSLGAQTSDRDLQFTSAIMPNLLASREGNLMIIEYYKEVIRRNKELSARIQQTARDFERRGKSLTPLDINDVVDVFWKDPKNEILQKDGKLNDLGQRMLNKAKGPGEAPPLTPPTTPPGGGAAPLIEHTTGIPMGAGLTGVTGKDFEIPAKIDTTGSVPPPNPRFDPAGAAGRRVGDFIYENVAPLVGPALGSIRQAIEGGQRALGGGGPLEDRLRRSTAPAPAPPVRHRVKTPDGTIKYLTDEEIDAARGD